MGSYDEFGATEQFNLFFHTEFSQQIRIDVVAVKDLLYGVMICNTTDSCILTCDENTLIVIVIISETSSHSVTDPETLSRNRIRKCRNDKRFDFHYIGSESYNVPGVIQ